MERLVTIMNELRVKCPWDKKQTIETLRQLTIEETFELADAITNNDWQGIKEELGDILLHIIFYAKIGNEQNQFTLQQVIDGVCEKLISRHPHKNVTSIIATVMPEIKPIFFNLPIGFGLKSLSFK